MAPPHQKGLQFMREAVSLSLRSPKARVAPTRHDSDISRALSQLGRAQSADELAFELKAYAADEDRARAFSEELQRELSVAREADEDPTPLFGVQHRAAPPVSTSATQPARAIAEAFGKWRD